MPDCKYSVKNTTKFQRAKLSDVALGYSMLGAAEPSNETMKLVNEYVAGNLEIAEVLDIVIEKYREIAIEDARVKLDSR